MIYKNLVKIALVWLKIVLANIDEDKELNRYLTICPSGSIVDSSGEYCCPSSCGTCGGYGCHARPGGEYSCCTSKITNSCEISSPPCTLNSSSKCPEGGIMDSSEKYCCPSSCGSCGGYGCDKRPGGDSSCCTSQITDSCDDSTLPCIISSTSCPSSSISDETGIYCCPSKCGKCGGYGCDKRPGGASSCCTSQITETCDETNVPCKLVSEDETPEPTQQDSSVCPENGILDSTGRYCCDSSCDSCMEYECTGYEIDPCCRSEFIPFCSEDNFPCALNEEADFSFCPDGIISEKINYCEEYICCPANCEKCELSYSCDPSSKCCIDTSLLDNYKSDVDVSCREKEPPCIIPPLNDPCNPNPCENNARCGTFWGNSFSYCRLKPVCECAEVGNDSGQFCEIECSDDEEPCGLTLGAKHSTVFFSNDICCEEDQECLINTYPGWFSSYYQCFYKSRPDSCEPNPCLNEGECQILNDFEYSELSLIYVCNCPDEYTGGFCETKK